MDHDLNPAVCLLISVENTHPEVTRLIAIEPDTSVGQLMLIVHAALGLEPSPPGHVTTGASEYELMELLDDPATDTLLIAGETVAYHPAVGTWEITLTLLSSTELPMHLPTLIDATGPDLVSAIGDPLIMHSMLEDLRMILAGVGVPGPKIELIISTFPTYSLPQVHQRLTECFPPLIAQRLGELSDATVATPLEALTGGDPFALKPLSDQLMDLAEEEWEHMAFVKNTALLNSIPHMDPEFELATLSRAHQEELVDRLRVILEMLSRHSTLTTRENLTPKFVKEFVDHPYFVNLGFSGSSRMDSVPLLDDLMWFLMEFDFIDIQGRTVVLTDMAQEAWDNPAATVEYLVNNCPYIDSDSYFELLKALSLIDLGEVEAARAMREEMGYPEFYAGWNILQLLGIAEAGFTLQLTPLGHEFLGDCFRFNRLMREEENGS